MATQSDTLDPLGELEAAPDDEYALLELRLDWPFDLDIYPKHRQLWLRMFVITEDPLSWVAERGEAWATATVTSEVLEVDVYVLLDLVRRELEHADGNLGVAVGRYASSVMHAALTHEEILITGAYPSLAVRGEVPRLIDDLDGDTGDFGIPSIQVKKSWQPVGFGALMDLVQDAFGVVDLDRTPVVLTPVEPADPECKACKGESFEYPSALSDGRKAFCEAHDDMAVEVNTLRIAHARRTNFAGWRAMDKAAMRINKLGEPGFAPQPPRIVEQTPNRNDPCFCGSAKKYKRCHGA